MKIIYVEDNPFKTADVRRVLMDMGYSKEDIICRDTLNSGLNELRILTRNGETIPFALTDMYYPVITGEKLDPDAGSKFIKRVKHSYPDIPVIVISSERIAEPNASACVYYNPEELWENKLKSAIKSITGEKHE